MTTESQNSFTMSKLLGLLELDEATKIISELFIEKIKCSSVGFLIWDEDLEEYGDLSVYGDQTKEIEALLDEISSSNNSSENSISTSLPEFEEQDTLNHLAKVSLADTALIVLGSEQPIDEASIEQFLEAYRVNFVLNNSWTYTELIRENRRLRNSYDELEDKTTTLEDQTRKLINDLTVRDSLRTKQVERERLVYWISHSVRSSVRIQEVLENTVEKIGTTLSVSRCHLLRAGLDEKIEVYHYNDGKVPFVNDDFLEGDGLDFIRACLGQKSPQILDEQKVEEDEAFNASFLEKLGMRSGLIQPIIMRDKVLGSLFLEDCSKVRDWSIDDMSLIDSLADHLAVAIENAELHREIEKQAVTDGLTGVANRRSFNEALLREFERAKRYSQDLSLMVVDLDFLKKINDTYGHLTGDEAIKQIGHVLAQSSRSTDITARYGGEEFCVLLPNTDIEMAEQLGERLRRLIAETKVEGPGNISASIGVASYPLHSDSSDMLFLRADEALYQAKKDGRNCIRVSTVSASGSELDQKPGDSKQSLVPEKT